ncbi:MAG: hypothetical protein V4519_03680 [Patescibacteria group bacterium]
MENPFGNEAPQEESYLQYKMRTTAEARLKDDEQVKLDIKKIERMNKSYKFYKRILAVGAAAIVAGVGVTAHFATEAVNLNAETEDTKRQTDEFEKRTKQIEQK